MNSSSSLTLTSIAKLVSIRLSRLCDFYKQSELEKYRQPYIAATNKKTMLDKIFAIGGRHALITIGSEIGSMRDDPLLQYALDCQSPSIFFDRWTRFEKYSHTQNRVKIKPQNHSAEFSRYCIEGGLPSSEENLLICGLMISFLEGIGCQDLECSVRSRVQSSETVIWESGSPLQNIEKVDTDFSTWTLRWSDCGRPHLQISDALQDKIVELIHTDASKKWRLHDISQAIGSSSRSIQRRLASQGSSYSQLLLKTRVQKASQLLIRSKLRIVDIAFITGFSDTAHLSRVFYRLFAITPSRFRQEFA